MGRPRKGALRVLPPRTSAPRKTDKFTPRLVTITPEMAADILNHNTLNNRAISNKKVREYARDMKEGRWQLNGETIIVSKTGKLLDGQHRLWACIESTPFQTLLVEGVGDDVMMTIDQGKSRTYRDVLRIRGASYTNEVASAARWWFWYDTLREGGLRFTSLTCTSADLDASIEKHPNLGEAASTAASATKAKSLMGGAILTFVFSGLCALDEDAAREWLHLLNEGAGMTANHPVHQLRERLLMNKANSRARLQPEAICALAIKSFNLHRAGRTLPNLRWTVNEKFPEFGAGAPR